MLVLIRSIIATRCASMPFFHSGHLIGRQFGEVEAEILSTHGGRMNMIGIAL
jgi:hypothetical protein